jgi:hypothetical protein
MTAPAPAPAIKKEIRDLIDVQIRVFGQPCPLTPFELDDCRRRAEQIKLLGQELDRISLHTFSGGLRSRSCSQLHFDGSSEEPGRPRQ